MATPAMRPASSPELFFFDEPPVPSQPSRDMSIVDVTLKQKPSLAPHSEGLSPVPSQRSFSDKHGSVHGGRLAVLVGHVAFSKYGQPGPPWTTR